MPFVMPRRRRSSLPKLLLLASLALAAGCGTQEGDGITVYSSRQAHLIKPLFDRYTQQTGVAVRYVTDSAGALMQRLQAEGATTPADLFLTVDAGNLWQAAQRDLLAPVESARLQQNIPAHLRDPDNHWFGLSVRARTIVYNTERVQPGDLGGYAGLADAEWRNRLCLRTSKKVYNQSLVAMLIVAHGQQRTEEIVRGWVRNLAVPPFSDDMAVMRAIAVGQCDVGIVNSYYFGRLQKENPDIELALYWPDREHGGVHVNISGAGVVRHADKPQQARKLLEWLSGDRAQHLFARLNLEYPANPQVEAAEQVQAWGEFEPTLVNVSRAGELQTEAVKLMNRAGYR